MADARYRNSERLRRFVPAVLLMASLISLTISTRSLVGMPERIAFSVFGFFQEGFAAVSDFVSDTADSIAELRRLRQEYHALVQKLERFDRMERDFSELRAENERLREQLGFAERLGFQRIAARVIAKDPQNLYATIVLDKGIADGIRKNMPVVAIQDGTEALVGRVLSVGAGTSIVLPLHDPNSFVAARLARTRHEGLVSGGGTDDEPLVMRYVKKRAKDEAQQGDLVVSSGLESVFPPDLAIGRVARIRSLDYRTSLEIDVDPALDFSRLEYVFVINARGERISSDAAERPAVSPNQISGGGTQ